MKKAIAVLFLTIFFPSFIFAVAERYAIELDYMGVNAECKKALFYDKLNNNFYTFDFNEKKIEREKKNEKNALSIKEFSVISLTKVEMEEFSSIKSKFELRDDKGSYAFGTKLYFGDKKISDTMFSDYKGKAQIKNVYIVKRSAIYIIEIEEWFMAGDVPEGGTIDNVINLIYVDIAENKVIDYKLDSKEEYEHANSNKIP